MAKEGTQRVGKWGEEQACAFLVRQGFRVVERNYHATVGEIDIVAKKGDDFYFIEVKTRQAGELANDLAITPTKLKRFRKTVTHYCYHKKITEGSFIIAGLLVVFNRAAKQLNFRLAVIY